MSHDQAIHKTKRGLVLVTTLSSLFWLTACQGGIGATRENQYQNARIASKIIASSDIELARDLDLLPLPDFTGEELSDVGKPITAPTAMLAPEVLNKINIQSLTDKSWLIAPENPSAVWPKLIRFLGRHQITIKRTEPIIGVLESSWFTVSSTAPASEQGRLRQVLAVADSGDTDDVLPDEPNDAIKLESEKPQQTLSLYRVDFKVEQAVKQGFSEVHANLYKAPSPGFLESEPNETNTTLASTGQRVAFLKVLASDLLQTTGSTSVSLLADSINTEPKAELLIEEGQPTLLVYLDQVRFYAMVQKSLTNAKITFESDSDTEQQVETYNIELDRKFLTKSQGRLPRDLKGRYHALELHLSWEQGKGRILVKAPGAKSVPPWYAEQVLTLIREFSV